ncbi:MAG: biotin--[acetyl-CoA-carboxylase] ligase [Bacteroides sp.]|nr:biotin--[acetyl-CoA-carboxylase] ligase [Bacteroides sp.]
MNEIILPSVPSTNTWAAANAAGLPSPSMVCALCQPEGRGQRGNSWESEPGQNLTLSFFVRPDRGFAPREQFLMSEATALAVVDTLRHFGIESKVKWPNDIYCGDMKICGILIEHSLMGSSIIHSIAGIGLNVNQTLFLSDAPNPISMAMVAGRSFNPAEVRRVLAERWWSRMAPFASLPESRDDLQAGSGGTPWKESLHTEFLDSLWRNDGEPHLFMETSSQKHFEAIIADVDPAGPILLRLSDGSTRSFAFKEISWL